MTVIFFLAKDLVKPEQAGLLPGSGVNLDCFPPRPQSSHDAAVGNVQIPPAQMPFRFLYIGRLLRDKGLKELVGAVELLKNEGLALELRLLGAQEGGTTPLRFQSRSLPTGTNGA